MKSTNRALDLQARVNRHFADSTAFWSDIYESRDGDSRRYRLRFDRSLLWVDAIRLPAGSRALDLGAGAGFTSIALASRGMAVDAIDSVPGMVDRIRERAAATGFVERVTAHIGDAHNLPAPKSMYDLVLALGVIPWLHDPKRAMNEMARVLKPGGYLIATCANWAALSVLLDPMYNPVLEPARRMVTGVLRRRGWRTAPPHSPRPRMQSSRSFDRLLRDAGLEKRAGETYGFGPITFLNYRLPDRLGVPLDRGLQALADLQIPLLRSTGVGYLVLAQKPDQPHPIGGIQ